MFLVWLVACDGSGSVTLSKGDPFGHVASAWWTSHDTMSFWSLEDGILVELGDYVLPPAIRLFSDPVACEDIQAEYQRWIDTSAFLKVSSDPCEAMPDALAALAAEPIPSSSNRLGLGYCAGDWCAETPAPGTYSDRSDLGVVGGIRRNAEDATVLHARIRDAWDPETCTFGVFEDQSEWLEFDTMELILEEVDETHDVTGTFKGHLWSDALDDAGTAAGRFSAGWCELPGADVLVDVPGVLVGL